MKFSRQSLIVLILALVIGLQAIGLGQDQPLPQDPAVLSGKLENGLSYYIMRNPKPADVAELRLFVNAGSVDEDEDQRGLAHFTEHMVFNGTRNFNKSQMVDYLSSIGMGYENGLNGMTSYDYTAYTFKIPTDNEEQLRKGLLILSDMAHQVSFDPSEIERERGVIIEEWRMGQDAGSRIRDAQNAVNFAGSRYAERSPIGTYEVISGFEHDTLKRFYRDWYRPDLQTVVIVGDFDPQAMLILVQEYFGMIPARVDPRPKELFYVPENLAPQAVVATDREYPRNVLNVMWKKEIETLQTMGDYRENLIRQLFYAMLNTRLDEHSKKPDPPFSFAASFEFPLLRTMSAAYLIAMFTEGKSEEALATVLTEAERVQRYGFLDSEFERAKQELRRLAEKGVADKDTRESEDIAWQLVDAIANEYRFLSPDQEYQILHSLIEGIGIEEVNAIVSELIPEKNMFIAVSGPQREGLSYPARERLLEIANTTNSLQIEPYMDKTVDEPLMAEIPAAKPVKKERYDSASGIRTWVLANGITVYSKKTDFKNDEVLLTAYSPGGFTRYPADHVPAANLLANYIRESGFGNFDAVSLDKATVGKVARASLNLGLNSEGVSASCSPQDLELMFQLIYQYVTNPRFDEQEFGSFIQRSKAHHQNRLLDPMNVFFDRMTSSLYNDNPYLKPLSEANLDEVGMEQLEHIYRDRFADFSDFSFVIVGNFDEARLKELASAYLGNLPALKRKDKIKDVGIRPVKGKKEIRFHKGESDRSFVSHITTGDYKHSVADDVSLDALMHVVNDKLRENIREERSGVYFIQAWPSMERHPKPRFSVYILMACAPSRVDELNAAIFATLDSIRAGEIGDKYLTSAKATLGKVYAEDIRSNRYWMNRIRTNVQFGRKLDEFLDYPACYDRINRETLVKTARKYLPFNKNKLSLIMLPEGKIEADGE